MSLQRAAGIRASLEGDDPPPQDASRLDRLDEHGPALVLLEAAHRLARGAAVGPGEVEGEEPVRQQRLVDAGEDFAEGAILGVLPRADVVEGLAEGGIDLFLVETLPSLDQARAALEAIGGLGSDVPVVVSMTFNEEGTTFYGDTPEAVVLTLEGLGVSVIGANCSQGPQAMLQTVERMAAAAKSAKLMAMPNAGAPALVEGRYVYLCTPEYMASYARRFIQRGVRLVGGCCGTTPEHIRQIRQAVNVQGISASRPAIASGTPAAAEAELPADDGD